MSSQYPPYPPAGSRPSSGSGERSARPPRTAAVSMLFGALLGGAFLELAGVYIGLFTVDEAYAVSIGEPLLTGTELVSIDPDGVERAVHAVGVTGAGLALAASWLLAAWFVGRGQVWARWVATVAAALRLGAMLISLVLHPFFTLYDLVIDVFHLQVAGVCILVLVLLWHPATGRWFAAVRRA